MSRRLVDLWHVWAVEFWGKVASWALTKVARHGVAARDIVTVYRVVEVLRRGAEVGWNDDEPNRGRLVPRRSATLAGKSDAELGLGDQ